MVNSLHSFETYKRIIELEERQGHLRKDTFSENVKAMSAELKELRKAIKQANKRNVNSLKEQLVCKKAKYEEARISEIVQFTEKIKNGNYEIKLREVDAKDKVGYATDNTESMLLSKTLMLELKRSYRLTPANRNNIIEEFRALLDNPMPKIVIRADFHEFFESIPQRKLIDKIIEDSYISAFSLKCLKTFIYKFNELSGNWKEKKGIPRGLSFSSYLAEIYLKSFDRKVGRIKGVYFYKRYVDDIIILANPEIQDKDTLWNELVLDVNEIGLKLSEKEKKRTCKIFSPESNDSISINYLGYKFRYEAGKLDVLLTEDKFNRYKECVRLSFEKYKEIGNFTSRRNDIQNRGVDTTIQFVHRLNALTGNGHLNGRKNFVLVGVFYSNKYLTTVEQLIQLDCYLKECLDNSDLFSPSKKMFRYDSNNDYQKNIIALRNKILSEYSFVKGFSERRLYRWTDYSFILKQLGNLYYSSQRNG